MPIIYKCPKCGRTWAFIGCFNYSMNGVVEVLCFECAEKELKELRNVLEKIVEKPK